MAPPTTAADLRAVILQSGLLAPARLKDGQINRAALSLETLHGHQFVQVLRLRTLSRFASRLPALVRASHITPFAWYLELREMLGELQALKLGQESFEVADYDHDNLYPVFREIGEKVRAILSTTVTTALTVSCSTEEPSTI